MIKQITIEPVRTYVSARNATRAVDSFYREDEGAALVRWFIACTPEGRFYPVFIGQPAIDLGAHFHFNVIG